MKRLFLILSVTAFLFQSCSDDDDSTSKVTMDLNSETTTNSITVSWEPLEDAIYYDVTILPDDEEQNAFIESGSSFIFEDLKADTEYEIIVLAGKSWEAETIIGEGTSTISTEALPAEFFGEWKYQYNDNELIYVFNEDGTGSYSYRSTSDIRWEIESDSEIKIEKYNDDGSSSSMIYDYEFINDDNRLLEIDGFKYWKQD